MAWISDSADGALISCRVTPRASKNQVLGVVGDRLKIKLQAPPVEGKANKALTAFLAETLDVGSSRICLVAGETGREKRVLVRGLSMAETRRHLGGIA